MTRVDRHHEQRAAHHALRACSVASVPEGALSRGPRRSCCTRGVVRWEACARSPPPVFTPGPTRFGSAFCQFFSEGAVQLSGMANLNLGFKNDARRVIFILLRSRGRMHGPQVLSGSCLRRHLLGLVFLRENFKLGFYCILQ